MNETNLTRLPPELRSLVESELESGEAITWADQPIAELMARGMTFVKVIGILIIAIPLYSMVDAWQTRFDHESLRGFLGVMTLIALASIFLGLGLLVSPIWVRKAARRSAYVLSDRRAIVIKPDWMLGQIVVRSIAPGRLGDLRRRDNAGGSGDLLFMPNVLWEAEGPGASKFVGFMAIRDVKAVEAMVRALAAKTPSQL